MDPALAAILGGDEPPPPSRGGRSPLTPDDLDDFERAATERPERRVSAGRPRGAGESDPTPKRAVVRSERRTAALSEKLAEDSRTRRWVMRGHLKWVMRTCDRWGVAYDEVRWWEL